MQVFKSLMVVALLIGSLLLGMLVASVTGESEPSASVAEVAACPA